MQPGPPSSAPPPRIGNNMAMSVAAIFLFPPLAVPALMNASRVGRLLRQGDYAGAQAAAAQSRRWSKLALIIGGCLWAVGLLCCGLAVVELLRSSPRTY